MKAVFLSDIHLGAAYIADPRQHEQRVVDFLRSDECSHTDELYLLGDILDYWFEYRNVVPRGYIRFFGELAHMADAGVKITWMTGNHDIWLFDYLRDEIGIEIEDAPYIVRKISGKNFLLAHGDRLGEEPWSFRFLCKLFRNKTCQKLYSGIHPRWTVPFAHNWSRSSRGKSAEEGMDLVKLALEGASHLASKVPGIDYIVEGHHHILLNEKLPEGPQLVVLGDWIDKFSYAVFDGENLVLKQFVDK